jgi:hypothetical protein
MIFGRAPRTIQGCGLCQYSGHAKIWAAFSGFVAVVANQAVAVAFPYRSRIDREICIYAPRSPLRVSFPFNVIPDPLADRRAEL